MGIAWVYKLRRLELLRELQACGLPVTGTVVQLRQRFLDHVRLHPDEFQNRPADEPGYKEDVDRTRDLEEFHEELMAGLLDANTSTPVKATMPVVSIATVLDQMRKWGCHFDGRELYAFLERVRELQQAYGLTNAQLLQGFPELLRGDAQLWYRNVAPTITTWEELETQLRRFYLPPSELRHLDQQIASRRQGSNEPIRSYATALLTLIRRRGEYTTERTLDALYYNMRAELRVHVRRTEVTDTTSLIQAVEQLEETLREARRESSVVTPGPPAPRPAPPARSYTAQRGTFHRPASAVTAAYSRETHCWRCKEPGHSRFHCRNPAVRFCSFCGTDEVLTRDCPCHQGNAPRAGPA